MGPDLMPRHSPIAMCTLTVMGLAMGSLGCRREHFPFLHLPLLFSWHYICQLTACGFSVNFTPGSQRQVLLTRHHEPFSLGFLAVLWLLQCSGLP